MIEFLSAMKPRIAEELRKLLDRIDRASPDVGPWRTDAFSRLYDYSTRGKMIRGSLVDIGARSVLRHKSDSGIRKACLSVGAAMELIQSLLLIHDDIMDQDDVRRGKPSMHIQYHALSLERKAPEAKRLGESLSICVGDVAGFLAFDILSMLDLPPATVVNLIALTSRELSYVGVAQMNDVYQAGIPDDVSIDAILRLYRYKTGRYTFSLPLMAGALIGGAKNDELATIGRLGELFGLIFQIKDDDIGLFGDPQQTGKPKGSDIMENKKTLHRYYLLKASETHPNLKLRDIFGNREASEGDIETVLVNMEKLGIREAVQKELDMYAGQCKALIAEMHFLNDFGTRSLEMVLSFNLTRDT